MPDQPLSIEPRRAVGSLFAATVGIAMVAVLALAAMGRPPALAWPFPGLHFAVVARAPLAVLIHLVAVLAAFAIGTVLMAGRKGRTLHRVLGWSFAGLMMTGAVASLFIHAINPRGFSPLHLLSGWTLIILPVALAAARRHRVRTHARIMTGLYLGGLVAAGLFAFMPGRLLWRVLFG